jgi:hypothetical protein
LHLAIDPAAPSVSVVLQRQHGIELRCPPRRPQTLGERDRRKQDRDYPMVIGSVC